MRIILALDFEGKTGYFDSTLRIIKELLRILDIPFYESSYLRASLDEIECSVEKK